MVHDQTKQTVKKCQVNLLVDFREDGLHHDIALALARFPDVGQVVDALAPLVDEKRRRLRISWLDPGREETALVGLEEQELVKVLYGTSIVSQLPITFRTRLDETLTASVIFSTGSIS